MAIEINKEFVDKYFTNNYKHKAYDITVKLYEALRVHFNGEYPRKLIDERRPNESDFSKDYRKMIYVPKTKATCTRITNSLSKMRRSPDWMVRFQPAPPIIPPKETPEIYINEEFPYFGSLTNWIFSLCLKNYLMDANAVCIVVPLNEPELNDTQLIDAFPLIFNSDQVIDYVEGQFTVLRSHETCSYIQEGKTFYDGKIIIVLTDTQYVKYQQVNGEGKMSAIYVYNHNIGELPAFKLKGQFLKHYNKTTIWESRVAGILPDLDEFVRMYSDFQAQVVQHIFSEKWVWGMNDQCTECHGLGYLHDNVTDICNSCHGTKKVKTSPYNVTNVEPANINLGQSPAPIPPMGYIGKEYVSEMTTILEKLLDKAQVQALAAVNMEYLDKVPLTESGTAKNIDRDEANNTVHAICEDLVYMMDEICEYIIDYRYTAYIPDEEERSKLNPEIAVPETFDLLNTQYLLAEMMAANNAKMNPSFVNKMQVEISAKKYPNDPQFVDMMQLIFQLDPFPALSVDEKVTLLQNNGIYDIDYVVSCNIHQFIQNAMYNNPEFDKLPLTQQKAILNAMAEEMIKKNSVADKILNMPPTTLA